MKPKFSLILFHCSCLSCEGCFSCQAFLTMSCAEMTTHLCYLLQSKAKFLSSSCRGQDRTYSNDCPFLLNGADKSKDCLNARELFIFLHLSTTREASSALAFPPVWTHWPQKRGWNLLFQYELHLVLIFHATERIALGISPHPWRKSGLTLRSLI